MRPPQEDFSHEVRKHDSLALRLFFGALGAAFLATGAVGIFVPVLPTVPLWLLAAACFARSSTRIYNWLLNHRHFGPMVRNWRSDRVIPLRAKQLASTMMAVGSAWAWWVMPVRIGWLPALVCAAVAAWMWQQPSRRPRPR